MGPVAPLAPSLTMTRKLAQKNKEPSSADAGLHIATAASFRPLQSERANGFDTSCGCHQSHTKAFDLHADSSRRSIVQLSRESITPRDLEPNLSQTSHLVWFISKLAIFIHKQLKRPAAFSAVQNGLTGATVRDLLVAFHADDGLVASRNHQWLQDALNVLVTLFQKVGPETSVDKTKIVVCHPSLVRTHLSDEACKRRLTGEGLSFRERKRQRVQCQWCVKNFAANHIDIHGAVAHHDAHFPPFQKPFWRTHMCPNPSTSAGPESSFTNVAQCQTAFLLLSMQAPWPCMDTSNTNILLTP